VKILPNARVTNLEEVQWRCAERNLEEKNYTSNNAPGDMPAQSVRLQKGEGEQEERMSGVIKPS